MAFEFLRSALQKIGLISDERVSTVLPQFQEASTLTADSPVAPGGASENSTRPYSVGDWLKDGVRVESVLEGGMGSVYVSRRTRQ